jgi:hypothetical protein
MRGSGGVEERGIAALEGGWDMVFVREEVWGD